MRISDWSSDVCSSDLVLFFAHIIPEVVKGHSRFSVQIFTFPYSFPVTVPYRPAVKIRIAAPIKDLMWIRSMLPNEDRQQILAIGFFILRIRYAGSGQYTEKDIQDTNRDMTKSTRGK